MYTLQISWKTNHFINVIFSLNAIFTLLPIQSEALVEFWGTIISAKWCHGNVKWRAPRFRFFFSIIARQQLQIDNGNQAKAVYCHSHMYLPWSKQRLSNSICGQKVNTGHEHYKILRWFIFDTISQSKLVFPFFWFCFVLFSFVLCAFYWQFTAGESQGWQFSRHSTKLFCLLIHFIRDAYRHNNRWYIFV